jgi:nicotinate-nucleotide adenylyltransferase
LPGSDRIEVESEHRLRLAIFGGTFDPIHCAHLALALEAARTFALDRVLFVPAALPPHKRRGACAAYEDRFRMVELACQGEPLFEPSRLEAGLGKSYSILTIEKLRGTLAPADRLFFLIGADAFAEAGTWYRAGDVMRAVEFIVASRPGHGYTEPRGAVLHRLDTLALPVSSSEIRQRLARGETPPEIPAAVLDYIRDKELYRNC